MEGRWDRSADWVSASVSAYRAIPSTAELPLRVARFAAAVVESSSATDRSLPAVDQSLATELQPAEFVAPPESRRRKPSAFRASMPCPKKSIILGFCKDRFPRGF